MRLQNDKIIFLQDLCEFVLCQRSSLFVGGEDVGFYEEDGEVPGDSFIGAVQGFEFFEDLLVLVSIENSLLINDITHND
eukprot:CAMPEP_0170552540 /NCGR_PEP_ID=MMETSP0211-20121228/10411_1 /TAXON_ID=311385 /ORGANISM="Pseudokeronopsis sp., Strain OXSARD2" /LENGTH=78 /DNA_ID=CAMNT_0010860309 /DNA_START=1332 /DNA_END=1568 /DNA_ORIENTATION=+